MDRTAQNAQLIAAIESGGHISEISRMLAAGASPRARKIVVLRARVRVDDAATPENGRPAWEWREDAVECEGPLALAVLRRRGDVVRALLSQRGSIGLVNGPVEWRVANWAIGARLWTRREWEQTRWFWTVRFPNALHLASGTGGTLTRWDGHKLVCPTEDYVVEVNLKGGVVQIVHPVGRDQAAVEVRLKWPGLGVMGSLVAKGARMEWKPTGPVEGPVKKSALLWGEMAAGRSSMESGSSSWATTIGGTESPVPTNYGVVEIVDHRETDRRTHHATLPQYTAPAARDLAASTEDSESDDKSSTSEWSTIPEDHDANGAAPAAEAVLEMVPVITGTNPQTNTTDDEAEEELQLNFDIISITEPANVDIDVDAPSSSGATWRRSESVVSLVPIAGACTVTEFGLVECNMGAAAVRVAVARVESASGGDVGVSWVKGGSGVCGCVMYRFFVVRDTVVHVVPGTQRRSRACGAL
ncbi:hypothetical protein M427DRAFT_497481 [Gonapodya prolifera JEL478]|uniref:Uncharacterized protein n=1 Tax=Gonapodya prolifera (strain JEL478) TaxID=1344416 RepID=A0A139AFQ5_GONPJ|nr:hypothetical protein M427DRAFT_497481 [Gonapodya prolifera JEL478]|eukprot:KXS15243.1 hypothetical protein M427DRAFT_497481 [Gonapodya prolifera JEL478]